VSTTARTILAIGLALAVATAAQLAGGQAFRPAAAADAQTPAAPAGTALSSTPIVDVLDSTTPISTAEGSPAASAAPVTTATAEPKNEAAAVEAPPATVASTEAAPAAPAAVVAAPAPVVAAPAPVARPAATPAPTVAPVAPVAPPAPAATPTTCAATWFCYPRLGIAGAIVPYTDCSGSTDIGTSIRSFACLPPLYLMGHAYTQFGLITQWRAGDVVFANGRQYTISGAFTQSSCQAPARVPAPLSLQTSLTSAGCGSVLVVQGN